MSPVIDELIYRNYAANRQYSPEITPERWAKVYGENTPAMEARFQAADRVATLNTGASHVDQDPSSAEGPR